MEPNKIHKFIISVAAYKNKGFLACACFDGLFGDVRSVIL